MYTNVWDDATPLGSAAANTIDNIFRSMKLDIDERLTDVLGITNLNSSAAPLILTQLQLGRTTTPKIIGGSTNLSLRNNANSADNILIVDAGDVTIRRDFTVTRNLLVSGSVVGNLIFTDNTFDIGASGATRPRTLYLGTSLITPAATITTLTGTNATFSGTLAVTTTSTFTGAVQINNNLTVTGILTAGSASYAGTSFSGNVIFNPDNTYDIGASGATRARDFFLARNAVIGGTLGVTGLITGTLATAAQGNITSLGTLTSLTVSGVSTLTGNLIFTADSTYDIGASGATRARDFFLARNAVVGGTLNAGSSTFTSTTITAATADLHLVSSGGFGRDYGIRSSSSGELAFVDFTSGNQRWKLNASGNFLAEADNTYDIGANGATRPRTGYFGTSVVVPTVTATTVTGTTATFTNLGGTLTTAAQGNVTSLGTLTSLAVSGSIIVGTDPGADGSGATIRSGPPIMTQQFVLRDKTASVNEKNWDFVALGNILDFRAVADGFGTATNIFEVTRSGTTVTSVSWRGNTIYAVDNTYDIGASGATRPRNLYVAGTGTFGSSISVKNSIQLNASGGNVADFNTYDSTGTYNLTVIRADQQSVNVADMVFYTTNSGIGSKWRIKAAGHFIAETDNTYDIGASGATRPRTGYFGTNIICPIYTVTSKVVSSGGDLNLESSGFVTIRSGGTTDRWYFNNSGHFVAATDNTYDVGAAGASRPRNLYIAGAITLGTIINTVGQNILSGTGQGTSYQYITLVNTGGSLVFGIERSTSGGLLSSSDAYASVFGTSNSTAINLGTNGTIRWRIDSSGHITAIADNTYDIGAVGATRPRNIYAAGTIFSGSSRALKENIRNYLDDPLASLNNIKIVEYEYKNRSDRRIGFIAEDTESLFSGEGKDSFDYMNLLSVAVAAIQKLGADVEDLRKALV